MTGPRFSQHPALSGTSPGPRDFLEARRRADAEIRQARRAGKSAGLLCFDDVRAMLKARAAGKSTLHTIPLDAIVGSMGRCSDFTRSFYPLKNSAQSRWMRVRAALAESKPLPPIQVVQVGQAYFVSDGHHRVSAAREQGMDAIEALVVTTETRVPLSPDVQPDELLLQGEYAGFLAVTQLDEIRPEADLSVTVPGQYAEMQIQITELHRFMLEHGQHDATLPDAATQWYDTIYLPVAQIVHRHRLVRTFQGRTEADLVLWLTEYRSSLEEALGWEIALDLAAADLARQRRAVYLTQTWTALKVTSLLGLRGLHPGPSPGTWRKTHGLTGEEDCLFGHILVPISGADDDWSAVAQAAEIACRENAQLLGLHVKKPRAGQDTKRIGEIRDKFLQHCELTGTAGTLAIEEGDIAACILERAHWADLIVLRPHHPPPESTTARLGCGLRTLIRRCPTPLLIVPGAFSALERPLLAYDGSPKAREALFVAAYLAARGQLPLVVVTIAGGTLNPAALLADAAAYLEPRGIKATFVRREGPVPEAILQAAAAHASDLILMGGYGHSPLVELISGSVVDEILRASRQPVLLCR